MTQRISLTALVVRDYAEAIDFYVDKLGFELTEDTDQGHGKRWVVVRPAGAQTGLLLAKAADAHQADRGGDAGGGRVMLFLETDDFERDHGRMQEAGVKFLEAPRREPYGVVAVFQDLYGNRWDLIEPKA
jgi:catechol 2,3-dioxygenase-like lactoylglutathione lyase family enzyme